MANAREIAGRIGIEIVNVASTTAKKIAEIYRAVDPDVMRHVVQLPLLSYTLFVSRRQDIEFLPSDGFLPLIFVHGLGGDRGNFLPMAVYLSFRGRKRSYRIHFEKGQSIPNMADALIRFIKDVKEITKEEQVEIVAHSLGGIVARLALTDEDVKNSVKTLITLGSPHKGTYAARYANTPVLRDIRPDSELIKRLNETPLPKGMRLFSLWSKNDLLVLPPQSAIRDGGTAIDMTPFTHYSYLISPKCWRTVAKALEKETL